MSSTVSYQTVSADYAGQRLDNYLFAQFRRVPKSHIYKSLRKGEFRVNKKRVKPEYRIQAGDILRLPPIFQTEKSQPLLTPSDYWLGQLAQAIVYEDDDMLAINKPTGLAVHGGSGVDYGVIEVMQLLYPKLSQLELVHRLDRDTSGCLLLAKKRSVLRELHQVFRAGRVNKSYYALTLGQWANTEQRITAPLRKYQLSSGERRVIIDKTQGKPSVSHYRVERSFAQAQLVIAKPITGRTHQLRVHAQYAKHPIAGDVKYGDEVINNQLKQSIKLNRLFLHATKLQLHLPSRTQPLSIKVPMPPELEQCLSRLE